MSYFCLSLSAIAGLITTQLGSGVAHGQEGLHHCCRCANTSAVVYILFSCEKCINGTPCEVYCLLCCTGGNFVCIYSVLLFSLINRLQDFIVAVCALKLCTK